MRARVEKTLHGDVVTFSPKDAPTNAEIECLLRIYHDGIGLFHHLLKRPGKCVWKWEV